MILKSDFGTFGGINPDSHFLNPGEDARNGRNVVCRSSARKGAQTKPEHFEGIVITQLNPIFLRQCAMVSMLNQIIVFKLGFPTNICKHVFYLLWAGLGASIPIFSTCPF